MVNRFGALMKTVQRVVSEKRSVAAKEQQLVTGLNNALQEIGYQVVASADGAGGPSAGTGTVRTPLRRILLRRPRPKMSAAARKAFGARMKAYWAKRRGAAGKKGNRGKK